MSKRIRTFDGAFHGRIAQGTNPWVEVDGVPVNWTTTTLPRVECPCGEMGDVVLPGVLDGTDTPFGVQRCDVCDTYPGDLEAAQALATLVGGKVRFESE